ncbi:hypothetical protein GCM10010245_66690 [Streptomyces spectabilis]|nr:hypothetical protein CP982_01140 [Streptomyces spectabilis]GGV42518.1 hypothetical protein GCM10010245_66690 [Streptomyces spectabilis]
MLLATGCGGHQGPGSQTAQAAHQRPVERGSVISATSVADLTAQEVESRLKKAGIETAQVRYGVQAHRIIYRTVTAKGKPTTASELVAMPKNGPRELRAVSWLHGTQVYRGDVASVNDESTDRATALLFASTGRAVSAPDYLGLGKGPGSHPYGHPRATVTASVDALRATREFARRDGHTLARSVLISGFSQGGPAAMMVGRALQQGHDPSFRVGALAPIAGPFDLSGFEAGAADDDLNRSPLYLAYFATAWNRMYGLYDTPSQAFRAPYDKKVETLFDGNHTGGEIAAALPRTSKELFTADFLDKVRKPTGKLRRQLHALDTTCDWRPEAPVHLFHAKGDKDVSFANSQHCRRQLIANGVHPKLSDEGNVDHNTTVIKALPEVIRGFDATR